MSAPKEDLLATARAAVALAKKHGASDAAATTSRSRDVETVFRDGKVEKISDATSRSLSLALYVDGRYGSMSTSDLRAEALDRFVGDAVGLVRALAKDPHRKLPDPALYAGRREADLGLWDDAVVEVTPEARLGRCRALEEAARSAKGSDKIISITSNVNDWTSDSARVASNGFEGTTRGTGLAMEASVTVKDDDGRRPEDWASAQARFLSDVPDPAVVGREATERAATRLGAKKIASGTKTVVIEARAARGLLRHLVSALYGQNLQQKESFLDGKLGEKVASAALTLTDEPLLVRGLASRPFDNEGIAAKTRVLFEKGALRSFLLDVYYASKLKLAPTTGRTTNLVVAEGKKGGLEALMKDVQDGVLVTGFLGGNSNATTGAFSLGFSGFRIDKGQKAEPIAEMNLAGKHLDFWKRLVATGDDTYKWSSTRSPSMVFEGVSIAGK